MRPTDVATWGDIPTVPTTAFKEMELSCLCPAERSAVFFSSGTSERRPSRHFHNAESLALYEAASWECFRGHCLDSRIDYRLAVLTPSVSDAPNSSLVQMFETARRRLGQNENVYLGRVSRRGAWVVDLEAALSLLEDSIANARPVLLLGTGFLFVHLLDSLGERDLRLTLPPGSRVMETGGYKGRSRSLPREELHELIVQRLRIPAGQIVCEYGMSELSSQAYDSATRVFRFPPWVRARVISPETGAEVGDGESGLIQVVDLANVYSVMAVQTEDMGVRRGDGFELIGRAALAEPRGCSLMADSNELA